jgi:hypothetical protein
MIFRLPTVTWRLSVLWENQNTWCDASDGICYVLNCMLGTCHVCCSLSFNVTFWDGFCCYFILLMRKLWNREANCLTQRHAAKRGIQKVLNVPALQDRSCLLLWQLPSDDSKQYLFGGRGSSGSWTQGLELTRQMLFYSSHTPSPFLIFSYL